MKYDDLLNILHNRVSVRRFEKTAVETGTVNSLLEAGDRILAACDVKPCRFQIIQREQDRRQIVNSWQEFYKDNFYIEQTRIDALRLPFLRKAEAEPPFMNAPVFILATGNRKAYDEEKVANAFYHQRGGAEALYMRDMATATFSLILATTILGLGSLWVSVGRNWDTSIKSILRLPALTDIHTLIAVGYPGYQPEESRRRKMVDMVHREKYDMDLYRTQEDIIDFLHNLRKITEPHYLKTEGRKKIKNENIAYSAKRLSDYLNLLDSAYNETAFAENPVPQEYITRILEASRWTMSGANAQPWEFLIVQEKVGRERIFSSEGSSALQSESVKNFPLSETGYFRNAPAYVLVLGDRRPFQATVLGASFLQTDGAGDAIYYKNMANAIHTIRLASASLGMSTICKSVNRQWEDNLKSVFNIPRLMDIHGIIALGFPKTK
jgi:nitroreductase